MFCCVLATLYLRKIVIIKELHFEDPKGVANSEINSTKSVWDWTERVALLVVSLIRLDPVRQTRYDKHEFHSYCINIKLNF